MPLTRKLLMFLVLKWLILVHLTRPLNFRRCAKTRLRRPTLHLQEVQVTPIGRYRNTLYIHVMSGKYTLFLKKTDD